MDMNYTFKNKFYEKNLLRNIIAILSIAIIRIIFLFFYHFEFNIVYSNNQIDSEKIIGVNMKGYIIV